MSDTTARVEVNHICLTMGERDSKGRPTCLKCGKVFKTLDAYNKYFAKAHKDNDGHCCRCKPGSDGFVYCCICGLGMSLAPVMKI